MQEIYKDIIGFENIYKISNFGNVFSTRSNKKLSVWKDKDGYLRCNLKYKGFIRQCSIHKLVAENFIRNTENKSQINHKNGIRADNRVENLEWCSCLENQRHKYNVLGYRPKKEVVQKMIDGAKAYSKRPDVIKLRSERMRERESKKIIDIKSGIIYNSQREAADKLFLTQSLISKVCKGIRKSTKGYVFRFLESYPVGSTEE